MFQLVTDTKDHLEEIHIHGKMLRLECHLFPEILVRKQIYMSIESVNVLPEYFKIKV